MAGRYWGAEKYRLQLELQLQTLSSSLEHQLLFEDYLKQPSEVQEDQENNYIHLTDSSYVVRGEDIKDIPTSYVIKGLEDYEFPVVGTYVDRRVVPGFRYRVRLNHSKIRLFGGEALTLKSVGMGYGKRVVFEDKKPFLIDNYFWSDTHSDGYGFSLVAVGEGDRFDIRQTDNGASLGTVQVVDCQGGQREIRMKINEDGTVEKTVQVEFWVNVDSSLCSDSCYRVLGEVLLVKSKKCPSAKVVRVHLNDFVLKNCSFYPL
ncbi:uncharacterized protein [Centruroides vittatus]|uniref:uncharacterized protein n=1 Tax=Centruroides vittatus TaxID=120091 RepID=UPI00350EFE7D